jgi:hypothetical protein
VAHPDHEFARVRARVGDELIAGVPQIVKVNAGQASRFKGPPSARQHRASARAGIESWGREVPNSENVKRGE